MSLDNNVPLVVVLWADAETESIPVEYDGPNAKFEAARDFEHKYPNAYFKVLPMAGPLTIRLCFENREQSFIDGNAKAVMVERLQGDPDGQN